ncbi:MAG: shikimate dehydrogenase [Bacteroidales bacterium]|nr:shikimate dehydrogenase [Bacteroidales bacterium]
MLYGLIGMPLGHSFSQKYFTEKFNNEHIDSEYNLYPLEHIEDVVNLMDSHPDLVGFNVTIPYKQQIIPFLDELDPEAAEVGAVNVVKISYVNGKRHLKGFNSDIYGFYNSIKPFIRPEVHHKALILGTGGASKAVRAMLAKLGLQYKFVSRSAKDGQFTYSQLNKEILDEYKVIVNCSPLGTFPNVDSCPDIPYEFITPDHLAFDLVYNPEETLFLRKAREHGAATKNGLEMLHLQAEGAWRYWNE